MQRLFSALRRHSRRTWLLWGLGVFALLLTSTSLLDPVLLWGARGHLLVDRVLG